MDTTRRRSLLFTCVAVVSVLVLGACGNDDADSPPSDTTTAAPSGTDAAPDDAPEPPPRGDDERPALGSAAVLAGFEGLDQLDGARFETTGLVGDDDAVVVWFWAPWCPTCRAIAPTVAGLADDLDVPVVGIAGQGTVEEMEEFVVATGTDRIVHVVDPDGSAWAEFGVLTQPTFALVAPDGTVDLLVRPGRDQLVERIAALDGG